MNVNRKSNIQIWLGILLGGFLCGIAASEVVPAQEASSPPNIVLILIDDLGYGDVGPYNSEIDFTPNIDRLAEEGLRFTDFHSNGPMCSPTRVSILTGMYQHRFGERFEGALSFREKDDGIPPLVITIADILKQRGYATGKIGKWHLGFEEPYLPNNYGFDEFTGLLSGDGDHYTQINRWGAKDWWHNRQLTMEEGYTTDLITRHSVEFIEKHKETPFFLYVSHLSIHFPWQGTGDPPHRKAGETYENDKWGIIPDPSNVRPHVVSMIEAVDNSVGEIIEALKRNHLDESTLVIFTSDNGGYRYYYQGEHRFENISDNGPFRGQKTDVWEGGHRVPAIARWPGKIDPGTTTGETVMTMDLFLTFANIAGAEIPENHKTDGRNLHALITGRQKHHSERTLFWKIGNRWAVRKGDWKLVSTDGEPFLFDLGDDAGEQVDLSSSHPDKVEDLKLMYRNWYRQIAANEE